MNRRKTYRPTRRNHSHYLVRICQKDVVYPIGGMAAGAIIGGVIAGIPGAAVGGLSGLALGIMNSTEQG